MIRNITIFALFLTLSYSATLLVPSQYPTIQSAIDAANPGDTILVDEGIYPENLLIEKDLFLHSVNGYDITIIDGSRSTESTIVIRPQSGSPDKPIVEIDGFGIKNGKGTDVINNTISLEEKVGGGLFVYVNSPKVNNCKFENNGISSVDKGGAVFAASDSDDIGILERDDYEVHEDLEPATGPLDFSSNIFSGNNAKEAKSAYILGFESESIYFDNGNFDVYGYDFSMVSKYWFKSSGNNMTFENGEGQIPGCEKGNIYVSLENGDNECNGDKNCPVSSIDKALSLAIPNLNDPFDIIVDEGIYSANTSGEQFPLQTIDYVDLRAPDGAYVNNYGDDDEELIFLTDAAEVDIINFEYFNQSTQQAFYFFTTVSMNEYVFQNANSLVLAYRCLDQGYDGSMECSNLGPCVGMKVWDTSQCGSGVCDVPVMADDGYGYTEGYIEPGETPVFILYNQDIGLGQGFTLEPIEPFISSLMFVHPQLVACVGEYIYNPDSGACEITTAISGDLNGDGLVNILDVVVLVNIVLGGSEPIDAGDLNGDGVINVLDVVMLVNIILNG